MGNTGMRNLTLLFGLLLLAACGGNGKTELKPSESGGSRAEGIVIHSSTKSLFTPVTPDWTIADGNALDRCRSWGYERASEYTGSQEICRQYDRHGRCTITTTKRYYQCEG